VLYKSTYTYLLILLVSQLFRLAVDVDVDLSSSDDSSDDVNMADIVAMTSAVTQPDDSGACCSHDVVPPADAGAAAAAGSESSGSGSEDSTSASSTSPSHTSTVDDLSVPMTDTTPVTDAPSETTAVSGSSAVIEEKVSVVGGFLLSL